VDNEVCARLYPPGDAGALGETLVDLFDDVDEASRLGAAARACVEREYEIGKVTDAHLRLLEDLVRRKAGGQERSSS
jgi:glycosyltransferase involved in cell wall biosynthesis